MLTEKYVVTLIRSVEQKHSLKLVCLRSPHVEPTLTNIALRYFCCFRYRFRRRVLCAIFFKPRSTKTWFLEETMAPQNILFICQLNTRVSCIHHVRI